MGFGWRQTRRVPINGTTPPTAESSSDGVFSSRNVSPRPSYSLAMGAHDPELTGRSPGPPATGALAHGEQPWVREFGDPSREWRRLFSEVLGTFLLVLAAVGAGVVESSTGVPISRAAAVTAPALTVMAVILFMGKVGGAHLNPVVSLAFALRSEFPWRRVPAYVLAQLAGGVLACLFLWVVVGRPAALSATLPAPGIGDVRAMIVEAVLTAGLVSVILGTASSAQNVGALSAVAVGAYIALAGLWSSPLSGASMNPVRSFAPDLIRGDLTHTWIYVVGPLAGSVMAVFFAILLRGRGGDPTATRAAEGNAGDGVTA